MKLIRGWNKLQISNSKSPKNLNLPTTRDEHAGFSAFFWCLVIGVCHFPPQSLALIKGSTVRMRGNYPCGKAESIASVIAKTPWEF
jgi:hypothetical protein